MMIWIPRQVTATTPGEGAERIPEENRRAVRDDKCTEHTADVKCTYKCPE
jgi:hypothetical protein